MAMSQKKRLLEGIPEILMDKFISRKRARRS
jgi:hypothetical protein